MPPCQYSQGRSQPPPQAMPARVVRELRLCTHKDALCRSATKRLDVPCRARRGLIRRWCVEERAAMRAHEGAATDSACDRPTSRPSSQRTHCWPPGLGFQAGRARRDDRSPARRGPACEPGGGDPHDPPQDNPSRASLRTRTTRSRQCRAASISRCRTSEGVLRPVPPPSKPGKKSLHQRPLTRWQ